MLIKACDRDCVLKTLGELSTAISKKLQLYTQDYYIKWITKVIVLQYILTIMIFDQQFVCIKNLGFYIFILLIKNIYFINLNNNLNKDTPKESFSKICRSESILDCPDTHI